MPSELEIPPQNRYLMLTDILSREWVADIRANAIPARMASMGRRLSAEDRERTNAFLRMHQEALGLPALIYGPRADFSLGRVFDLVFRSDAPEIFCETELILKHAITWGIALPRIAYGHHAVCIFECPLGLPPLISAIPPTRDGSQLRTGYWLGLCSQNDWPAIRHGERY